MKRTLAISASVLTLSSAGLIGLSPTAQADSRASCGANRFCLYEGYSFERGVYRHKPRPGSWYRVNLPSSINDQASSMVNNTKYDVFMYSGRDCFGDAYTAAAKSSDKDLAHNSGNNKGNMSNRVTCITVSK
ncbi:MULTISPECIES: peptidase inhibitor family I36 protein [unclassified Streptomyces]|uniref:peptidase inhibitor family I36 protein n=1 Tax=unclassified Streptomyces TaxID=2593676 RepID=UPI002DD84A7A|nr:MULTISPECIES: peptidase inhibitor family I36 protein [unclassified Streptomyces]WSB75776.1 peptidase inhibitor family I36 protein [Streptomyces sp. NBC_01775]WSS15941.1 peptidase inhibitor family I36 protein [Streptomyces sp. NBC_01186]WSS44759.1 peptidase inhibitor family I36 protein [Streptomyces sp. NBC_01187]